MKLTSPAFENAEHLPRRFSRDAGNVSPPLVLSEPPAHTQSIALIVDDPDAPRGLFTHWLVWNLPPHGVVLSEGHLPGGAREGRNDFGETGYGGPRPPSGTHRYFFHAYALDCPLDLPASSARTELERAIQSHVIATADLMGRYSAAPAAPVAPTVPR